VRENERNKEKGSRSRSGVLDTQCDSRSATKQSRFGCVGGRRAIRKSLDVSL
jgi:hypothetical protein